MLYFVKKPKWVRRFYGDCIWEINTNEKALYLTFDDGPDPAETPFVLEQLDKFNAKATFFCIGKNVAANADLYQQVVSAGHSVGNHTHSHIDGWKTRNGKYFADIQQAATVINSSLFRPPFGHITWNQVKNLKRTPSNYKTVLWNVLSADFDEGTPKEKCLDNVINSATAGSIILFHDSSVASRNMRYTLPRVLQHFNEQGYTFKAIQP
jgi:peptidoglycan/xylan/chitin deacetylase (PgdA/CDA1 family)